MYKLTDSAVTHILTLSCIDQHKIIWPF